MQKAGPAAAEKAPNISRANHVFHPTLPSLASPHPSSQPFPKASGRALARAALGREFPLSTLSIVERVPSPTIDSRFQPPPLKFRTVGFPQYGFKLRHLAVRSAAFRHHAPRLSPIPDIPAEYRSVCSSLRDERPPARLPASVCGPSTLLVSPEPRGPRSSRVMLSLPSSLGDLIRQSGDLCLISQQRWL